MSQVRGPPIITPTLGVVPGVEWRDAGRGECVFFSTEVTRASNQGGFWIVFQSLLLRWLQLSDNDQAKRGKTIMARNQNNRESSVICDRWRGVARSYCYCYCHCFLLLLLLFVLRCGTQFACLRIQKTLLSSKELHWKESPMPK